MIEVWRLVRRAFCPTPADAFTGEGAAIAGGRWNRKGTRLVYASWTRSLAVLEILAVIDRASAPSDYVFASAALDDSGTLQPPALPEGWRVPARSETTVEIGEAFVADGAALAVAVPSVIVPQERNYLINPLHPFFHSIRVSNVLEPFSFDERLFG